MLNWCWHKVLLTNAFPAQDCSSLPDLKDPSVAEALRSLRLFFGSRDFFCDGHRRESQSPLKTYKVRLKLNLLKSVYSSSCFIFLLAGPQPYDIWRNMCCIASFSNWDSTTYFVATSRTIHLQLTLACQAAPGRAFIIDIATQVGFGSQPDHFDECLDDVRTWDHPLPPPWHDPKSKISLSRQSVSWLIAPTL